VRKKQALVSYPRSRLVELAASRAPQSHRIVCRAVLGVAREVTDQQARGGTMGSQETGQVTGTKDKDYNVIWFTEQCLSNVLRLETYIEDADREGDSELADFFRRAQETSRKGAEQGKEMLAKRL
jgi:hypothetical protein